MRAKKKELFIVLRGIWGFDWELYQFCAMGEETANLIDLDLNLGPLPDPDDALLDRLLNLEEFIVSHRREHSRQREIRPLEQSEGLDLLRERLAQREIHPPEQLDGLDQLRESLTQREMQLDQLQERLDREMQPLSRLDTHRRERLRLREARLSRRSSAFDRIRESLPIRARPRHRSIWRHAPEMMTNSSSNPSSSFLSGETSVTLPEREADLLKVSKINNPINVDNEKVDEGNGDKGNDDEKGSFFDCNICLELSKDPVVTCCGHLFCWPCIYQWLNIHSIANECPVCKGEVTMKNVIPIYGRGSTSRVPEHELPGHQIPVRPHAQRVESVRQTILRNPISTSIDEMVRHLSERTGRVYRDRVARGGADVAAPRNVAASSDRIRNYFVVREREEQPPPLDDRDSVSSIAAIIQSESQTIDTALEIDSNVSLSTSTSRRRNRSDVSRASDVDSGDSRPHRRRLN